MKIETLKDLRDALSNAPDELLHSLSYGSGEGTESKVDMVASEGNEEYDFPQVFDLINEKYPELNDVSKFIRNIAKANVIMSVDNEESERISDLYSDGYISSEDKFD